MRQSSVSSASLSTDSDVGASTASEPLHAGSYGEPLNDAAQASPVVLKPHASTPQYLDELKAEKLALGAMTHTMTAPFLCRAFRLIDKEIKRVEKELINDLTRSVLLLDDKCGLLDTTTAHPPIDRAVPPTFLSLAPCPSNASMPQADVKIPLRADQSLGRSFSSLLRCGFVTVEEKIFLPLNCATDASSVDFNFIGRLMGPRGLTIKRLEKLTGCRMWVRGRGSVKCPSREELLRQKPGFQHLNEKLHILVQCTDCGHSNARQRLSEGVGVVRDVLTPVENDELKQRQMRELAIINGTYRPLPLQPASHRPAKLHPLSESDCANGGAWTIFR